MRALCSLLRYHLRAYTHTTKYVMPVSAMLITLGLFYANGPLQPIDAYVITMSALFFVMVWIGFVYWEVEDRVSEQLLILSLASAKKYYIFTTVFLFLIGAVLAAFSALFPLLIILLNGATFFTLPITFNLIFSAFLLHLCIGFLGCSVGAFFHPRVTTDRGVALLITLVIAIIGFVKAGIHRVLPLASYITWLFPPLSDVIQKFSGKEAFDISSMLYSIGITLIYALIASGLRIFVLIKKKF